MEAHNNDHNRTFSHNTSISSPIWPWIKIKIKNLKFLPLQIAQNIANRHSSTTHYGGLTVLPQKQKDMLLYVFVWLPGYALCKHILHLNISPSNLHFMLHTFNKLQNFPFIRLESFYSLGCAMWLCFSVRPHLFLYSKFCLCSPCCGHLVHSIRNLIVLCNKICIFWNK